MNYVSPLVVPKFLQGPGAEQQLRDKLSVEGGTVITKTILLTIVINPGEYENLVVM